MLVGELRSHMLQGNLARKPQLERSQNERSHVLQLRPEATK